MALFSQEKRHIRIHTPLGKDVLHVESMHGSEGMSRLFSYELLLASENQGISFEEIVGKGVTIAVDLPWGKKRFFNGIISRFAQSTGGGTSLGDTRTSSYHATIVPWFWLLSKSAESRIYQNMSTPDIVEKIFKELGFSDFEMKLQGTYSKREYCVQYRETHFNFVSRLLEDEGIHYFFEHTDGKHKMVLADAPQANLPCPMQKSASYQVRSAASKDEDFITSLEQTKEIRTGKYSLNDFNFQIPSSSLMVDVPSKYTLGPGGREIYDYPGDFDKKADGERLARIRMEEEEALITTITGSSTCRAFSSGFRFTLNNHFNKEMNGKEFVLASIEHNAHQSVHSGGEFDYGNRFTCIPADVPFRPPRLTPKPFVQGAQTAMVVGPAGEEIHVDGHGRVKVQFHWDREGKKDEKSSCWIRVSQLWAGSNWGAMFIPRVGQEVIVDFLEGDPDRPIVTGRVYNGINKPPYPLPAEKTKSTIKSNSSVGGGGFNEIRFEDKKGNEEIYIHGEKDWDIHIKNDTYEWIGNDLDMTVKRDQYSHIEKNRHVFVDESHREKIGKNYHLMVQNDRYERINGDQHLEVSGNQNEKVSGTLSLTAGSDLQQKVGGKYCHDAGSEIHLKGGMKVIIEAGAQLSLKGPGGFIDIGPAGVTISGTMVLINSGGAAGSGSGASPTSPKAPKEPKKRQ